MSISSTNHTFALLALAATSTAASAAPVLHDGRYYEVVVANDISWDDANAAANDRTHQGVQGHLATINSPEEDAFIHQLRVTTLARKPSGSRTELWVGGFQEPCEPEPGCGWKWINGESISPLNNLHPPFTPDSPYTHWLRGEPNNLTGPGVDNEKHLGIGLNGAFGWNDEGRPANVRGYVVEYGDKISIPASACAASGPGCNPTGFQLVKFPASTRIEDGAIYTVRTTRINDDAARCGVSQLTLFDGAVVIPEYLCGHPDFLVVQTETTGVEVLQGAVFVENQTEVALPDNLYGCDAPIPQDFPDFGDPTQQDVVAWQSTDPERMLETDLGMGLAPFEGTVGEFTNGCGSSRGLTKGTSFYFIGLRIHPGPGNDWADNTLGNHSSLVALQRYKLVLLQAAVVKSKLALTKLQFNALKTIVDATIHLHDRGNYRAALLTTRFFLHAVQSINYKPIPGENLSGEHLMRGSNIEFMYRNKIIPYAP